MKNIQNLILECKNMIKSPEHHSPFGLLPVEILNKIFGNLSFAQTKKLRLVCPRWRSIVDNKMKFNAVLTNSTLPWLQNCNYKLESLCMQDLTSSLSPLKTSLPHVQDFIIGRGNSSENVLKFLSYFSEQTHSMNFQNLSMSQIRSFGLIRRLPRIRWTYLTKLSISLGTRKGMLQMIDEYKQHIDAVIGILKSVRLPTLKSLSINLDYADGSCSLNAYSKDLKKPLLEVLSFIIKHQNSLRELNLSVTGNHVPNNRILGSERLFELPKLHLEKFSIRFDAINAVLASALTLSVNKVTSLKIRQTHWTDGKAGDIDEKLKLSEIFRKHGPTLEILETRTVSFPFLVLGYLVALKSLEIRTCRPNNIGYQYALPLPTLTKFTGFFLNGEIAQLDDRLVRSLTTQFPNTEEVEVILLGTVYVFTKQHLENILRMPKIRKLRIGQSVSMDFLELCDSLGGESGLKHLGDEDRILTDNMESYHSILLKIDRKLLPVNYIGAEQQGQPNPGQANSQELIL